jgi:hypothetical protein
MPLPTVHLVWDRDNDVFVAVLNAPSHNAAMEQVGVPMGSRGEGWDVVEVVRVVDYNEASVPVVCLGVTLMDGTQLELLLVRVEDHERWEATINQLRDDYCCDADVSLAGPHYTGNSITDDQVMTYLAPYLASTNEEVDHNAGT